MCSYLSLWQEGCWWTRVWRHVLCHINCQVRILAYRSNPLPVTKSNNRLLSLYCTAHLLYLLQCFEFLGKILQSCHWLRQVMVTMARSEQSISFLFCILLLPVKITLYCVFFIFPYTMAYYEFVRQFGMLLNSSSTF